MFFNDRRQAKASARALKKAQGPSLASSSKAWTAVGNRSERHEVKMNAEYDQPSVVSRKTRYARAAQTIQQNINRTGNPQGKKK